MAISQLSRPGDHAAVAGARAAFQSAEQRAQVTIRELSEPADLAEVTGLLRSIWGASDDTGPPLNRDTLRALADAGNYVAAAFDGTGIRGALVGFLGENGEGLHLHSHILGVAASHGGRGTGFALKLHQRTWALERGHDVIEWTFDPLIGRNAYFNLTKLGGDLHRYHVDFYGPMRDLQNAGDHSDRVRVRWHLRSDRVLAAVARVSAAAPTDGDRAGAQMVLAAGEDGRPTSADVPPMAATLLVQTPDRIVEQRRSDPEGAMAWRWALREALTTALAAGYRCSGVTRAGEYVLRRHDVA